MKTHNTEEWAELYKDRFDIIDPDGWDRSNLAKSFAELITEETFLERAMMSTVRFKKLGLAVWDHSKDRLTLKDGV
tara:strand:- start:9110 stop:9337 length:228 start_codon:yes stop_codon:yes gene_type:complete